MIRRRTAIILATGLLAPLALVGSPAGAALEQDLVVTPVAGPPGTAISVSSASCAIASENDASLSVSMYSGTAPNQQIIAFAEGWDGEATLTIPDWVDPDQPAVIEADCASYGEEDVEEITYTPVDFDVEAGAGTPVQVRTFSRTELQAGQGFLISGNCGAGLSGGIVQGIVGSGTDQTGKTMETLAGQGFAEIGPDGSFEMEVYVTNAFVSLDVEIEGDEITAITPVEEPMNVPDGDYTAFTYCSDENVESLQFLEPQTIVVNGAAPTSGMDLTAATYTSDVTAAGTCLNGDVTGGLESISIDDLGGFSGPDEVVRTNRFATVRTGAAPDSVVARRAASANLVRTSDLGRALADDGFAEFEGTPGADGAWSFTDAAGFDDGAVLAVAFCGDPLADGYIYDPQGVTVDVQVQPTVPPTVPVTVPTPVPANAVSGTPDYAG